MSSKILIVALFCLLGMNLQGDDRSRLGGMLTVNKESKYSFGFSAPNIPLKSLRDFAFGNKMFNLVGESPQTIAMVAN